ncbi:MAG: endo-1,4-beta-xylanase [Lachnospiraceae bacterium]|nr:endo-1,4-beta-xylanase [Lachnospiraceae bacterium]
MRKLRSYLAIASVVTVLFSACKAKPAATEPTVTPEPTATPELTVPLDPTDTPEPTGDARPTEMPEATEVPVPTGGLGGPLVVLPTKVPEVTEEPAATEAPAPTGGLGGFVVVVTKTPEATKEPAVTAAPAATATPVPTATSAPMATPTPTAAPAPTKAPETGRKITYDFHDLSYIGSYGTVYEVQSDGSIELRFENQYQEIKLRLPEEIDMSYCHKVTVKALSSYANLSVKLYDEGINQVFVEYHCKGDTVTEFTLSPDITDRVTGIGLMALDVVDDFSRYKVTVYEITFHMDAGYKPAPTPTPFVPDSTDGATLLNTYGSAFGRIGTCINYSQLQNPTTLAQLKTQYNSITLENEMKPDFLLGWSPSLISVSEAKALGYVIPDNYKETTVPKINFGTVDNVMRICAKNGIGLRAHTLVWHSQTPSWFFRQGYNGSGAYVSKEQMDARMEFYIRTVMTHVYDNEYGYVVYSWDVVNEYVHATNSGWEAVYGNQGLTPSFVKLAYEIADDVLKDYGIRDEVTLIFNDFNTYLDTAKIKSVMQFINAEGKICDGVGMQAHLSTSYPTEFQFKSTVQTFLNEGYEVQITEMDVGNKGEEVQALYLYELMKYLLEIKKAGGKITGITYWGLADNVSWRKDDSPLLFSTLTQPKKAYYRVLQAYVDAGFKVEK